MYFYLINSVKRRFLLELQDSFSKHPVYQKIVPKIQTRYSFKERPDFGIVLKSSSANKVQLSADNFLGTVASHVMLAYVGEPVYPIEWVREDTRAIELNNDVMLTPPGVYYIEILSAPENSNDPGTFALDPLYTVTDDPVLRFQSGIEREAQLERVPVQGTLRLWENRRFLLTEGTHYTVDYSNGAITFITRFNQNSTVTADYRYAGESIGPIDWYWNRSDFSTLPGVVLAFGKRGKAGDKVAVVIYPDRVNTAQAYGGRFDLTFEFDVIVKDDIAQTEEIVDLAMMYLWNDKRATLSREGIEITDVSIGGEAEESYDDTGDNYYFTASFSVQVQADWEVHIPLPLTISRVSPVDNSSQDGPIKPVLEVPNHLYLATSPISAGRNDNFERIR